MRQLGIRVEDETAARLEAFARDNRTTRAAVVEEALDVLIGDAGRLSRGALNESEQLSALSCLEGFAATPGPGRAMDFVRRFAARLLDTAWLATKALDDNGLPQPSGKAPHIYV